VDVAGVCKLLNPVCLICRHLFWSV